jgi:DNA-binding beta-propeller fold protein YncE
MFFASPAEHGGMYGVAVDRADQLYVSDSINNSILKFTPAGVESVFANSGLTGPTGLAFDSEGSLYVANGNDGTIVKLNSDGVGTLFAKIDWMSPTYLAIDPVPEPSPLALVAVMALCGFARSRRPKVS